MRKPFDRDTMRAELANGFAQASLEARQRAYQLDEMSKNELLDPADATMLRAQGAELRRFAAGLERMSMQWGG